MYSYTYDSQNGGIELNSSPVQFSKEPRPVYAPEMNLLGFGKYWQYENQSDVPYLWAESNVYYYKNTQIAKTKGGNLYEAPLLIPCSLPQEEGTFSSQPHLNLQSESLKTENLLIPFSKESGFVLEPIDIQAMCASKKNVELMQALEGATVKKIIDEYQKFKDKLDIFHVAFSGGKDSEVMLDLIKKSLPQKSFVVIFGDTGMEFPDTYEAVEKTKQMCFQEGIPFYTARSHFEPETSWRLFGPPARVLRWCCSVHKSAPQTLKMRQITAKANYVGMDFVGVRRHESVNRSTYEYENYGKKQRGQYSFNPILDWTSAEVWLYIFMNDLPVNAAYKKGNSRAGCLLCPMSSSSDYIRRTNYTKNVDKFISIIKETNAWDSNNEKDMLTYITSAGWINRRSGRILAGNFLKYKENNENEIITIELINPSSDWKEWIKTAEPESDCIDFDYTVQPTSTGVVFSVKADFFKKHPSDGKFFRQALKKAAYCVGCKVCEANCKNGHLKFENGKVHITNCIKCHECHDVPAGCHAYNSLKIAQGEKKVKVINCFDDHAPKTEWFTSFFDLQDDFFDNHTLGQNMIERFRRFLRDANLIERNKYKCTEFSKLICKLGWETDVALGLMIVNLAYDNPQFEWYINNLDIDVYYDAKNVKEQLLSLGMKDKAASSIVKAFARIVKTPFGTNLNFGYTETKTAGTHENVLGLCRTKCRVTDVRVVLYALYKFDQKCNLGKEFSTVYLYDETVERDGVSPVRLFGLYNEEEFKAILLGLSSRYPDFINATFTNNLRTITLRDKTPEDVLKLFEKAD